MKQIIISVLLVCAFYGSVNADSSINTEKVFLFSLKAPKKETIIRLKTLPDGKLVNLLKTVRKEVDTNDRDVWSFAGTVFNELSLRHWSKTHKKQHEAFRQFIIQHSNTCLARSEYALETAGMLDKKTNKVFHPYPFNKMSKKLIKKWHKTSTEKALDDYIQSYMPKREIKYLKGHSVQYLSPSQHGKYKVTFTQGKVRIGNKIPFNNVYIYALGIIKNKPVLLAGFKKKGKLQHTSFFAGAPVLSVGEFTVVDEKIVKVRASSGHYHPNMNHAEALIEYLKAESRLGERAASKIKVTKHK